MKISKGGSASMRPGRFRRSAARKSLWVTFLWLRLGTPIGLSYGETKGKLDEIGRFAFSFGRVFLYRAKDIIMSKGCRAAYVHVAAVGVGSLSEGSQQIGAFKGIGHM